MTPRNPPPRLWLLTDARNDAALDRAIACLPPGSGVVFRHYHLDPAARRARFCAIARIAKRRGHVVALSADAALAQRWGADAIYGAPARIAGAHGLLRIATAHSLHELGAARRAGADLAFLSPVFATRSHPGGGALGPVRASTIARQSPLRVIALGGMNAGRARGLASFYGWAAIDGLSTDCGGSPAPD